MDQLIELIKSLVKKIDLFFSTNDESPYVISVSPQDIVSDNKTIRLRYNKAVIQNMSNYKVFLFRTFTLIPGQTLELGSEENNHKIITDMQIEFDSVLFDSAEADIKRVEILQINRIGTVASFTDSPSKTEVKPLY